MANTNISEHPGILHNVSITFTVQSLHLLNNIDILEYPLFYVY